MRLSRVVAVALAVSVAAAWNPRAAEAQGPAEAGSWVVTPNVAYTLYDDATPFEDGPSLGLEAHYAVTPNFAVGTTLSFARPEVDGNYFPLVLMEFGADSVMLFEAGQQVTEADAAVVATLGATVAGRGYLYAQGGAGAYSFFLDPQVMQSVRKREGKDIISGLMVPVAGGFAYQLSGRSGFRLEVRDQILFDFDRSELNPVEPRFRNTCDLRDICMPEANGDPPAPNDTVHNLRLMLGFEFVPGG